MFVRDFIDVERPISELLESFLGDRTWIESALVAAALDVLDDGCNRTVSSRCGTARRHGDGVVVPVHLLAEPSIPRVDGDVRVAPSAPAWTHISLNALWPSVDDDPATMQHVVDRVARAFLHRVVADLADEAPGGRRDP